MFEDEKTGSTLEELEKLPRMKALRHELGDEGFAELFPENYNLTDWEPEDGLHPDLKYEHEYKRRQFDPDESPNQFLEFLAAKGTHGGQQNGRKVGPHRGTDLSASRGIVDLEAMGLTPVSDPFGPHFWIDGACHGFEFLTFPTVVHDPKKPRAFGVVTRGPRETLQMYALLYLDAPRAFLYDRYIHAKFKGQRPHYPDIIAEYEHHFSRFGLTAPRPGTISAMIRGKNSRFIDGLFTDITLMGALAPDRLEYYYAQWWKDQIPQMFFVRDTTGAVKPGSIFQYFWGLDDVSQITAKHYRVIWACQRLYVNHHRMLVRRQLRAAMKHANSNRMIVPMNGEFAEIGLVIERGRNPKTNRWEYRSRPVRRITKDLVEYQEESQDPPVP